MGCLFSKCCCWRFGGSKNLEFDLERDVIVQSRVDATKINDDDEDDLEMSIQNQTSIENQNVVGVDIGDGKSYDNSPMPNHRNVAKAYSASTDSTVTMEAATTIPPVSNQQQQQQQLQQQQQHKKETSPPNPSHSQKDPKKVANPSGTNPSITYHENGSTQVIVDPNANTNTLINNGNGTSIVGHPCPVIKVTPANPRLESGSSSSDDESDFEFEEDDGRLRVPQDDDEWEETDDDDEDNEDVIMKHLGSLPHGGIRSTSSLPLEDINEEDSEDEDEDDDDVDLPQFPDLMSPDMLSPDVMSPDLMSPDSLASRPQSPVENKKKQEDVSQSGYLKASRRMERTWSFDSNRELVERDLDHSEDEEEKGSLQEKLYKEIVQRFGPDPEFDEKLENKLRERSQMRNEIEEELMRQADREEREKVLNKPEMEREFPAEQAETEVEELLKEYDLADRPIGTLSDPDSALVDPSISFKEKTLDLQPIVIEEKQEMELIHESQKNADSSSLFVSLKQIPIKEKDNLSNESSFETVPGQGDRLIHDNETNPVDPVFHGNPDPKLWPEDEEDEIEFTFESKPISSGQVTTSVTSEATRRPMSVELIPPNSRLRSSFHNLVIIPIKEDS